MDQMVRGLSSGIRYQVLLNHVLILKIKNTIYLSAAQKDNRIANSVQMKYRKNYFKRSSLVCFEDEYCLEHSNENVCVYTVELWICLKCI